MVRIVVATCTEKKEQLKSVPSRLTQSLVLHCEFKPYTDAKSWQLVSHSSIEVYMVLLIFPSALLACGSDCF